MPPPSVRYRIEHFTAYDYSQSVSVSHHLGRLCPQANACQTVHDFRLEVNPVPALCVHDLDYFGNRVDRFSIQEAHERLEVTTHSDVEVNCLAWTPKQVTPPWEEVRDGIPRDRSRDGLAAFESCFRSEIVPLGKPYADYASSSFPKGRPFLEGVMDLTKRINADFSFDATATTVATPVGEVLENRRGVCQDFAHLQIACLRSMRLPARYVSGYVRTEPPPGRPRLVGVDATHAWVAVYCPGFGWVEFDPTNQCVAANNHVRVAYGRDFEDVSPLRGTVVGGGWQQLTIGVTVRPSDEDELAPAPAPPQNAPPPLSQSQNQSL
ncbi:MAG: transglutaminase family protein [Verrucomicrobiae bacterium]|nr:transglutaminase family protein [Verrucomicrobiae bacterium]